MKNNDDDNRDKLENPMPAILALLAGSGWISSRKVNGVIEFPIREAIHILRVMADAIEEKLNAEEGQDS